MDPRALRQQQLRRLAELGVALKVLDAASTRALLDRFAEEFVDPARRAAFDAARSRKRPIDFERYVRAECVRERPRPGSLSWLAASSAEVHRFERFSFLPALAVTIGTLDDVWATSWPGLFVSFTAGRALVVNPDYERFHCDLRRVSTYR